MPLPKKQDWIDEQTIEFLKANPEADDATVESHMSELDGEYEGVLNEMRGEPVMMEENEASPIIPTITSDMATPPQIPVDPNIPNQYQQATPTDINLQAAAQTAGELGKSTPVGAAELGEGALGFGVNVAQNLEKIFGGTNSGVIQPAGDVAKSMLENITENTREYYTGQRNERPIVAEPNTANLPESTLTRQKVEDYILKTPNLSENAKQILRAKAQPETAGQAIEKAVTNTPGAQGIINDAKDLVEFVTVAPVEGFKTIRIALADAGLIDANTSDAELKDEILKNPMGVFGRIAASAAMGYGAVKGINKARTSSIPQTEVESMSSKVASDQNLRDTVNKSADFQQNVSERNTPTAANSEYYKGTIKPANQFETQSGQRAAKEAKANVTVPDTSNYYPEIRENNIVTKDEIVGFYKGKGETITREEAARRRNIAWPDEFEMNAAKTKPTETPNAQNAIITPPEIKNEQTPGSAPENVATGQETAISPEMKTETGKNNAPVETSGAKIGMFGAGTIQNAYDAIKKRLANNANNVKLEKYLTDNLDPKLRENIKSAEGIDSPSVLKGVMDSIRRIKNEATRHFPDLDEAKYPELANTLRVFEDAGDHAKAKAYYLTKEAVKDLNDKEYSIFRDNIVLSDLKRGVESGLYDNDLPFGFDKNSLNDHLKKVDPAEISKNPELADSAKKIQDAIQRRTDQMRAVKEEAVKYKLLRPEILNDDRYFHHQVLEYMNMKDNTAPGVSSGDVRVGGPKGYRRGRTGSLKDFNTEYAQSEWEVMSQMLKDVETAKTLEKLKGLDITEQLKQEAEKQGLPKTADTLSKLAPEGYTTWQPERGNRFFKAFTIPERIVDEILKKNDAVDVGMDDITESKIVGTSKETWVIPEDVVKTLDNLREYEKTPAIVETLVQPLNTAFKINTLLAPARATNYMFTNLIGDADALMAYAPKAFTKLPSSVVEIYKNDRLNNKMLEDAYNQSVIGTGMTAKEIADVNFADLVKGMKATDWLNPVKLGKKYFEKIAAINNFRENALRYSVFKDFKERIDAGEQNIYGASDRAAIDAIKDPTEKAAKLSRDLMGDYGNISAQGEYLAKNWIPFYRWMEINTPRYYRMFKNAPFEGGYEGALKGGAKTFKRFLQMNALGTVLYQLYHKSLGAVTGEDESQKAQDISKSRNQLHTIIPRFLFGDDIRDKVRSMRIAGAFSDVTDMIFGTSDLFSDVMDVAQNRMTFKEKAKELGWSFETPADLFNIPAVRKYTMAASPIARTVAEVSLGKAFGRNWGESRPIKDPYQHIARSLALGTPYDIANDTPREKPSPADVITYKTDLGEIAYNEMTQKKRQFLEDKGVGMMNMTNTPAGAAYLNLKRAYRYDKKQIPKFMKEFNAERAKLGQKDKSYSDIEKQMKEGADIRKFQKTSLRDEFYKNMTKEDRRKWIEAVKWYKTLYGAE